MRVGRTPNSGRRGSTSVFSVDSTGPRGLFPYHCHNREYEDMGMMCNSPIEDS
jgi:FtsP/CotA-like multicopper oxidase with cupredoxin domain